MAITELIPGLEVDICSRARALHEHRNRDEAEPDDRTDSCYIAVQSGEFFEVQLRAKRGFEFWIKVDGFCADGPLICKRETSRSNCTTISKGCPLPKDQLRKYRFKAVDVASNVPLGKDDVEKVKALGTIKVIVDHVYAKHTGSESNYPKDLPSTGVLSEKSLKGKAVSHMVDFAEPTSRDETTSYATEPVIGIPNPFATFIFHYCSLDALKSMLIIPRTPSPLPLEERDIDTLNRDELRELQKQLKTVKDKQAAAIKVKRERGDDDPRPRKVARLSAGSTQPDLDDNDDGATLSGSIPAAKVTEVIELD